MDRKELIKNLIGNNWHEAFMAPIRVYLAEQKHPEEVAFISEVQDEIDKNYDTLYEGAIKYYSEFSDEELYVIEKLTKDKIIKEKLVKESENLVGHLLEKFHQYNLPLYKPIGRKERIKDIFKKEWSAVCIIPLKIHFSTNKQSNSDEIIQEVQDEIDRVFDSIFKESLDFYSEFSDQEFDVLEKFIKTKGVDKRMTSPLKKLREVVRKKAEKYNLPFYTEEEFEKQATSISPPLF